MFFTRAARWGGLSLCLLLLFAPFAYANGGTNLIWGSMFYLLLANAFIGWGEGRWIAWRHDAKKLPSILWLVAANYGSAWFGWLGIYFLSSSLINRLGTDGFIRLGSFYLAGLGMATYIESVLFEFPFYFLALPAREHRIRRAIAASVETNFISYLLILPFFWMLSSASLLTEYRYDPTLPARVEVPLSIYCMRPEMNSLIEWRIPEGTRTDLGALPDSPAKWTNRYFILLAGETEPAWDLRLVLGRNPGGYYEQRTFLLLPSIRRMQNRSWETHPIAYLRRESEYPALNLHPNTYGRTLSQDIPWSVGNL